MKAGKGPKRPLQEPSSGIKLATSPLAEGGKRKAAQSPPNKRTKKTKVGKYNPPYKLLIKVQEKKPKKRSGAAMTG